MTFQPYHEPLRATLLRNGIIALVVGGVLASLRGGLASWPAAAVSSLWPALGGHFVEICFLNVVRPRLSTARAVQVAARLVVWLVGGTALALAMCGTAALLGYAPPQGPAWGIALMFGGLAFIGIELIAHLALQLRGRPSFFNGRA